MLHRSAAITGLVLLATHVGTVVVDSYVEVSLTNALVPLTGPYKTLPVAAGTVALWLTVLVALWGLARGRLAASDRMVRRWRAIHASAYAAWTVMLLHGLLAGTDRGTTWARALFAGGGLVVVGALAARVVAELRQRRDPTALVRAREGLRAGRP
jgi:sulfoxide reductase heme-binding subunit YedZ